MENSSYFYNNKGIFGHYPSQLEINELEKMGIIYFVDLTVPGESLIKKYNTNVNYLNYPINDNSTPVNIIKFTKFLLKLKKIILKLSSEDKIYIHCKAGHGRCGIVVSCLLFMLYKNITSNEALLMTNEYHNKRIKMRDRWRKIGSPQTKSQKNFVRSFLGSVNINNKKYYNILSLDDNYRINLDELGIFNSSRSAYEVFKNLDDKLYILSQRICINHRISKFLGKNINIKSRKKWNNIKYKVIYKIIKFKIDTYPEIKNLLLSTGIKKLKYFKNKIKKYTRKNAFSQDFELFGKKYKLKKNKSQEFMSDRRNYVSRQFSNEVARKRSFYPSIAPRVRESPLVESKQDTKFLNERQQSTNEVTKVPSRVEVSHTLSSCIPNIKPKMRGRIKSFIYFRRGIKKINRYFNNKYSYLSRITNMYPDNYKNYCCSIRTRYWGNSGKIVEQIDDSLKKIPTISYEILLKKKIKKHNFFNNDIKRFTTPLVTSTVRVKKPNFSKQATEQQSCCDSGDKEDFKFRYLEKNPKLFLSDNCNNDFTIVKYKNNSKYNYSNEINIIISILTKIRSDIYDSMCDVEYRRNLLNENSVTPFIKESSSGSC